MIQVLTSYRMFLLESMPQLMHFHYRVIDLTGPHPYFLRAGTFFSFRGYSLLHSRMM